MNFGDLEQMRSLPLEAKIIKSQLRIKEWYDFYEGQVFISFSGGKDSTVLLDLVRDLYPNVPAVFVDTGLEYPEIREFVKSVENVTWLHPSLSFKQIIEEHGYPVISKENAGYIREIRNTTSEYLRDKRLNSRHIRYGRNVRSYSLPTKYHYLLDAPFKISDKCCHFMKRYPIAKYTRKTHEKIILGTTAAESRLRLNSYLKTGCNSYNPNNPQSKPLSFWREEDIWEYINTKHIPYSSVYDIDGIRRTGCMFCGFGLHLEEEPNRFQQMKITHPKQWKYCLDVLGFREVFEFMHIAYE